MKITKKIMIFLSLLFLLVLFGCSNEQTFEEYFHEEMERHEAREDTPYFLVYLKERVVHENDAIAIFKEHNQIGEQIFIAYFENNDGEWNWKQTRGAEWGDKVNWSAMQNPPYIYSGATLDESISEIYVGNIRAEIITVEGKKRFWYAISNQEDVKVKFVLGDGKAEIIESIDWE